jgi:hypothetical protein
MNETGRLIAIVLLASFAIERAVATVDFFLDGNVLLVHEKRRKLVLFAISAILAIVVIALCKIRVLASLGVTTRNPAIDWLVSWLILVGGADKLGDLLGGGNSAGGSGRAAADMPPIQIIIGEKPGDVTVTGMPSGR